MHSIGHGDKRSRKQDAAIAALLKCQTISSAAEKAARSAATLQAVL